MICRVQGELESVEGLTAVLAQGDGSAREVMLPAYLAERFAAGAKPLRVTLHTIEYLDSPNQGASFVPRLVGFAARHDRAFFELFTTVKGIGNRKALKALAVEPAVVARAIQARDVKALTQLPEVGKRLAETIVAELHGKVEAFLAPGEVDALNAASLNLAPARRAPAVEAMGPVAEAIQALVALGEVRVEAERLVEVAVGRLGDKSASASADDIVSAVFGAAAGGGGGGGAGRRR
ncbi:MAG: Holliday junction branch migration protein RuvA [Planctomycetota bacterium]|nr:Holliday junction branch migration protein RuvA [Planctomycetota bacterium]